MKTDLERVQEGLQNIIKRTPEHLSHRWEMNPEPETWRFRFHCPDCGFETHVGLNVLKAYGSRVSIKVGFCDDERIRFVQKR